MPQAIWQSILTSLPAAAACQAACPGQPAGEGRGPPGVMMTWHAAARAADATAFALGVIASKLVFEPASGPEDPVCSPLLSFLCSCDSL